MENQEYMLSLIKNAKLHVFNCRIDYRETFETLNRTLNFYVASYIKEGSCTLRIGKKRYYTGPGDVIIIPPHVTHDHYKETHDMTCFMWWHFTYSIGNSVDLLSLYDLPVQFNISNNKRFEEVFSQYFQHSRCQRSIIDYIMTEAKGIELIGVLLESVIGNSESKLYRSIHNVFLNMLNDILEHPVQFSSLETLSEKYHLHPTYISNQFKKLFRVSPISLSRKLCLEQAQQMLAYDSCTINEIAAQLGYEEPGNFTRFFKMKLGITPQQFRAAKNLDSYTLTSAASLENSM